MNLGLCVAFINLRAPEDLVAMVHAANDTIGIDNVRRNETTIGQNILTSLQIMSTSILCCSHTVANIWRMGLRMQFAMNS